MMEKYVSSVGRNTNMLLGIVIDSSGRVPAADVKRPEEVGNAIRARYGCPPACEISGTGRDVTACFGRTPTTDRAVARELISRGGRVRSFELQARTAGVRKTVAKGQAIGRKRILEFAPVTCDAMRLYVPSADDVPQIRSFAVFER